MKPPLIRDVKVIGPMRLRIDWSTGEILDVDLSEQIARFKVLQPLREPAFFALARVGEWGHSVFWNEEVDLGADRLYERCHEHA